MNEDKQVICDRLLLTLQATRNHVDLEGIQYEKRENGDEIAALWWRNGASVEVNVTADSGTAMIRDILAKIG